MGTSNSPTINPDDYEYEEVEVEEEEEEEEEAEEEDDEEILRNKMKSDNQKREAEGEENEEERKKVKFALEKNTEHIFPPNSLPPKLKYNSPSSTSASPSSIGPKPPLKYSLTSPSSFSTTSSTSSSSSTSNPTTLWAPTNISVLQDDSPPLHSPASSSSSSSTSPSTHENEKELEKEKHLIKVPYTFLLHFETQFGQELFFVGNLPELGSWNVQEALLMTWNFGHYWRLDISLPAGSEVEYKFFLRDRTHERSQGNAKITFEGGDNHHLSVPTEAELLSEAYPHPLILSTWSYPSKLKRNRDKVLTEEEKQKLQQEATEFRASFSSTFTPSSLEYKRREKEIEEGIERTLAYRKSAMWNNLDYDTCGFTYEEQILVMDVGTETLRVGFAGEQTPRVSAPSIVGSKKSGLKETFLVLDPSTSHGSNINRKIYSYRQPLRKGVIENWDDIELMWKYYIFEEKSLLREHSKVPLLLSESVFNPKYNREKTLSVLFETLSVPSVSICNQETLALHASTFGDRRATGLVVNSGADTTQVVPIYEGAALRHCAVQSDIGGKLITKRLCEYFHITDKDWYSDYEKNEKVKKSLVLLSSDEVAAKRRHHIRGGDSVLAATSAVSEGFLDKDRYLIPDILFRPEDNGHGGKSLQDSICNAISKIDPDLREEMLNNIVLVGGNSMIQGFPERLFEELNRVLPYTYHNLSLYARPERANQAWLGGSLLASQAYTPQLFISKALYEECGASIVHRMCL